MRRWLAFLGMVLMVLSTSPLWAGGETRPWDKVRSWGYQLQNMDLAQMRRSAFDLIVMDYSRDGTAAEQFTRAEIDSLKHSPHGRKLVLAYMSIGEAESYRFYWNPAWYPGHPAWLGTENTEWKKNFAVKYWDPEWQQIICGGAGSYLDRIINAGFDGVYLDIVDGYQDWEDKGYSDAAAQMKQFVARIARYAREERHDPSFGVFPQNGEPLLADTSYLSTITGIGREDTYYGSEKENVRSPSADTAAAEKYLALAVKAHKLVLNVDYCHDPEKVRDAYTRARARGYIEYCTEVDLDRLTVNKGFDPLPAHE
ncbi:MAG: MJ1477/TM1410 family putative glycoside hydrolase [Candidatus Xenobia bacterium]